MNTTDGEVNNIPAANNPTSYITERAAHRFVELDSLRSRLASGDVALEARLATIEMGFLARTAGIQADLAHDVSPLKDTSDG